jgi:hypothetical protein
LDLYKNFDGVKDITYYILAFNLRNLAPYLEADYWEDQGVRTLAKHLSTIDLKKIFVECDIHFEDHILLEYIHETRFISDALKKGQNKVDAIVDHYHGQNTGFNSNVRRLRERYFTIDNFLSQNFVMYDIYGDYDKLVSQYTQGLLASYGNNKLMSGKLIHFNDHLLDKLLLNGNAGDIQKFLTRFKLKEIEYYQTEFNGSTLTDKVYFLFDNHQQVVTVFNNGL